MTNKKVSVVDFIVSKEGKRAGDAIDRNTMKALKQRKEHKHIHAVTNVSLHNRLDGSEYIGWLINQVPNNMPLYFEDCYGGKWKLQKLKK